MKVLFVRNLATPVTEELLEKTFSQFGKLERVKKLKDYAFVHFEDRDAAVKASIIFSVARRLVWLEMPGVKFGCFSLCPGDAGDER